MSYSRKRGRTDGNLTDIVDAARRCGFLVEVVNNELCDAVVQLAGVTELWECKHGKGRVTAIQAKHKTEGWRIRTVRTVEDVTAARRELHAALTSWGRIPPWDTAHNSLQATRTPPEGQNRGKGRPGRFIAVGRR